METMLTRVAVALSMADPDERGLPPGRTTREFYEELARAALTAMREPTEAMKEAVRGKDDGTDDEEDEWYPMSYGVLWDYYASMIKAALNPTPSASDTNSPPSQPIGDRI